MSALPFVAAAGVGPGSAGLTPDVECLHANIVEQLDRVGVQLPEAVISAVAEVILADAVRISLRWLETG
jgi:hypothetical protein